MEHRIVDLGSQRVGAGLPCFITFEAGPTHNGLQSAMDLVSEAAQAGANAVKFQIVDPDRLVPNRSQPFSYNVLLDREDGRTETVTEPLYDILCRRTLTREEWRRLKAHADGLRLAFFATGAFPDEVDFLVELGCHSIKIASGDVDHLPLIRQAARTGLCLQLDTGNATLGEIEVAVDVIESEDNHNIIIHNCPSGYPARLESINLNLIPTLKRMFPYPVAYSDHTPGWEMDVAAVAMGADLVEKTITFDRTTRSVEHIMSLEPREMGHFVRVIRDLERAFGNPRRIMDATERKKRLAVRRSTWLARDCPRGHELTSEDFEYRRPGGGISPSDAERLVGRQLLGAKAAGTRLDWGDLGPPGGN